MDILRSGESTICEQPGAGRRGIEEGNPYDERGST